MEGQYAIISKALLSMKEEYKISPTLFLKKKIKLAEKSLKAADKALGSYRTPNGNYPKPN